MSRVDEALRRAAAEAAGEAVGSTPVPLADTPAPFSADGEFPREPFPLEMPERRQLRAVAGQAPVPPSGDLSLRPVAAPVTGRPSLLQRLDFGLSHKVVIDEKMLPASREQYRLLAAGLHHAQSATGLKVVMIASALSGEGKTLTATNLALTLSESYHRKVLLIDADLRRPSLHAVFAVDNSRGLSDGLAAAEEQQLPVRQVSPRLAVLPAGASTSDPMARLTSDRMRRVIEEAREHFDWVIIDTPPVGLLPDANLLAAMVDGAVVVVKAESTSHELVQRAVEAIGRTRMLGVVLNQATGQGRTYGYESYDYYSDDSPGN